LGLFIAAGMRPAVPFGKHGWDRLPAGAFIAPWAMLHVLTSKAVSPHYAARGSKHQEQEEQGNQETQETKAKEWPKVTIRHPVAIIGKRLAALGGGLDIHRSAARHPGVEGKASDAGNGSDQYKRHENSKNDMFEHFTLLVKY
jgi:hypothetical protein